MLKKAFDNVNIEKVFFFVIQLLDTRLSYCTNSTLCTVRLYKSIKLFIEESQAGLAESQLQRERRVTNIFSHFPSLCNSDLSNCAMQPQLPCVMCISPEFKMSFQLFLSRNVHFDISLCTSEVLRELFPYTHDLTMGQVTSPRFPSQRKCVCDSCF